MVRPKWTEEAAAALFAEYVTSSPAAMDKKYGYKPNGMANLIINLRRKYPHLPCVVKRKRHIYTPEEIELIKDHYNRDIKPADMAARIGVKVGNLAAFAKSLRKQDIEVAYPTKPIGTIRELTCQGKILKQVKTEDGWQYISSRVIERKRRAKKEPPKKAKKARAKRPMPVKQFKQQQEMKSKKPTPNKVQEQARTRARKEREEKARFKTRDHGKLIRVRIDHKTELLVPPERVAAIKAKYKIAS